MQLVIDGRPVISAQEAAYRLGKSVSSLFKAAKQGAFKVRNIHSQFVDEAEFSAWKEKEAVKKDKSQF